MKTSNFPPGRFGHICKSYAGESSLTLILVLFQRLGETNPEARNPPLFDEVGFGKVSFRANLSVK